MPAEDVRRAPGAMAWGGQWGCSRSLPHSPHWSEVCPKCSALSLRMKSLLVSFAQMSCWCFLRTYFPCNPGMSLAVCTNCQVTDPGLTLVPPASLRCLCSDLSPSLPRPCSKQATMAGDPFEISSLPKAAQLFHCWSLS